MPSQSFTENVLEAPDDEIICWCNRVTKGTILSAIKHGATSLEEIRLATKACTVGHCKELNPRGRCCSKEIKLLLSAAIPEKEWKA